MILRYLPAVAVVGAVLFAATTVSAQPALTFPEASQQAKVVQRVGLTDIVVSYHRPLVNGRTVWGELVPYGEVWRTGANENTTISFSTPVTIGGSDLDAGTYGLHTIPGRSSWTVVLSNNSDLWGSFNYEQSEDALRFTVTPAKASHQEAMLFVFDEVGPASTTLELRWAEVALPIDIAVDTYDVVFDGVRTDLRALAGFFPASWAQAANYALANNINHDEALAWIDRAIQGQPTFGNILTKAQLLQSAGRGDEGDAMMADAVAGASENELNTFGYQLMGRGDIETAIKMFTLNVERHPESWNVHDSLAEAYANRGDKDKAIELYSKALSMVNDESQKARIRTTLSGLGATAQ